MCRNTAIMPRKKVLNDTSASGYTDEVKCAQVYLYPSRRVVGKKKPVRPDGRVVDEKKGKAFVGFRQD